MSKFRKGDTVTVVAIVESAFSECDLRLRMPEHYADIYAKEGHVTMLRPHIEVGDMIEWDASEKTWSGEVLAIADDHAWVSLGDGNYSTVWLSNVRRLDVPPSDVEIAA